MFPPSTKDSHHVRVSFAALFAEPPFVVLFLSLAANLILLYVLLFQQSTTFLVFFESNTKLYTTLAVALTVLISLLAAIALTQAIYIARSRLALRRVQGTGRGFFGTALGAIATGCPSCSATLLPALGIAGSLAAFPLKGLEIKLLSIIILVDAVWEGSRTIAGVCQLSNEKLLSSDNDRILIRLNRRTFARLRPILLITFGVLAVYFLPRLPARYKLSFARQIDLAGTTSVEVSGVGSTTSISSSPLDRIHPEGGYTVNMSYGMIGPQLLAAGAIDFDRFVGLYENNGRPLTDEQIAILTKGSDEKINIDQDNAHFLLNLLWALGLANSNPILDEGPLMQYGKGQIGSFASTGGWTLGAQSATDLYSQSTIVMLEPEQQQRLEEVAYNTYRPCCNNSTAFADCNHGMAMLGLLELMASQGASVDEMFEAAKYFNAFWFPQQYVDLAIYFKTTQGIDFADASGRTIVSRDYSSGSGWTSVRQWLANNDLLEEAAGGGGCGV